MIISYSIRILVGFFCLISIAYTPTSFAVHETGCVPYEESPPPKQHAATELFNKIIPEDVFEYGILPKLDIHDIKNLYIAGRFPFLKKYLTIKGLLSNNINYHCDNYQLIKSLKTNEFVDIVNYIVQASKQYNNLILKDFYYDYGVRVENYCTNALHDHGTNYVSINTLDPMFPLRRVLGFVDGTFKEVKVSANEFSGYDVSIVLEQNNSEVSKKFIQSGNNNGISFLSYKIKDTQILTATSVMPTDDGILSLADCNNNTIELKYASSVIGITSAIAFQQALERLLINGKDHPASISSNSFGLNPVYGIASITTTSKIAGGKYCVIYDAVNDGLYLDDGRGSRISIYDVLPTNNSRYTFSNGVTVTFGSSFIDADHQVIFEVINK